MKSEIKSFHNHISQHISATNDLKIKLGQVVNIAKFLKKKINQNKKIFVYGNGGSYADGLHFVAELISTYKNKKRKPLPFIVLGTNIPSLTAWSNDNEFDTYLTREVDALSKKGDVLILISTSGGNLKNKQSINLLNLAKFARKKRLKLVCFLGKNNGLIGKYSVLKYHTNSLNTPIIQETQKIIFHLISDFFDKEFK